MSTTVGMEALPTTLWPKHIALLYNADPKTVSRWVRGGKIAHTKTKGGDARFNRDTIFLAHWLPLALQRPDAPMEQRSLYVGFFVDALTGRQQVLNSRSVGNLFGVTLKTVNRWVYEGRLTPTLRGPGGKKLFVEDWLFDIWGTCYRNTGSTDIEDYRTAVRWALGQ